MLGHGAGGGVRSTDLVALARQLPQHGYHVVLHEQPWRVAGRRIAVAPTRLDEAWLAATEELHALQLTHLALVVGGRSAGARVACRTAAQVGAAAVLALAFPLHPPRRPERSRANEIPSNLPVLVVQGTADALGQPDEFVLKKPAQVFPIPGANHSFTRSVSGPLTNAEILEVLVAQTVRWLRSLE